MVVGADDDAFGERLRHQDRRRAEAAAEVGDPGAGGELGLDPIQRGNPVRDQLGDVAWAVERVAADEHVLVVLVPAHARSGAERLGDHRLVA